MFSRSSRAAVSENRRFQSMVPRKLRGWRSRKMFSATVSSGMRLSSWWMIAMPARSASRVPVKRMTSPRTMILPSYDGCGHTPLSTFISVDLPAPFSPTSARTSPPRTSKSTPSRARTPGKSLTICSIFKTTSAMATPRRAQARAWKPSQNLLRGSPAALGLRSGAHVPGVRCAPVLAPPCPRPARDGFEMVSYCLGCSAGAAGAAGAAPSAP